MTYSAFERLQIKFFKPSVFSLGIALLAACASTDSQPMASELLDSNASYTEDFADVSINTLRLNAEQDLFQIGDSADISFYNVKELSNTYTVDREGNVNFPLIGVQKVAGITTLQLQQKLSAEYGQKYLQNPNITVKREATVLGKFVIDGSVTKPGVLELSKPISLSEAVAMAGGLSKDADQEEVFVIREVDGEKKIKKVDLKAIRKMAATDPIIYPNDVVFIQDSNKRIAYSELLRSLPLLSTILLLGRL